MARMPRVVVSGYPHHVTQRGNRRQKTFFCVEDYQYYLDLMSEYTRHSGTEVWVYCLMPNHVHLVMVPGCEDGLRSSPGEAHRRYTRHITQIRLAGSIMARAFSSNLATMVNRYTVPGFAYLSQINIRSAKND